MHRPPTRFAAMALLFLLGLQAQPLAADSGPRLQVCAECYSDAAFQYAAENASLARFPTLVGDDAVYLLNPRSREVRLYSVARWIDEDLTRTGRPMTRETPRAFAGLHRATATRQSGRAEDFEEIQRGLDAAIALAHRAGEGLDFVSVPGLELASAIDLVGPEDSESGLLRIALSNVLATHLNELGDAARQDLHGLSDRAFLALALDASSFPPIRVGFADDTRLRARVEDVRIELLERNMLFFLEVDPSSTQGKNLLGVPQSPGQFSGYSHRGQAASIAALARLARRLGVPVAGEVTGSAACSISCNRAHMNSQCEIDCPVD